MYWNIWVTSQKVVNNFLDSRYDSIRYTLSITRFKLSSFKGNKVSLTKTWPTIYTRPHITHFERKTSRPDISIRTTYEITPITILKQVFHEVKHEEVYICIIILKVNG